MSSQYENHSEIIARLENQLDTCSPEEQERLKFTILVSKLLNLKNEQRSTRHTINGLMKRYIELAKQEEALSIEISNRKESFEENDQEITTLALAALELCYRKDLDF